MKTCTEKTTTTTARNKRIHDAQKRKTKRRDKWLCTAVARLDLPVQHGQSTAIGRKSKTETGYGAMAYIFELEATSWH